MVVSNLGSIVLALPSSSPGNTTAHVAHEVRLLALANTLSRLAVGPLADALAPVASRRADGVWAFSRKRHTSRVAFMIGTSLLLALTFAWLEVGVRTQEAVWPLSVGTGVAYGAVFTVMCVPPLHPLRVSTSADARRMVANSQSRLGRWYVQRPYESFDAGQPTYCALRSSCTDTTGATVYLDANADIRGHAAQLRRSRIAQVRI